MAVQLTITMSDAGQLNVTGPIDDLLLCFGLLEAAKDVLRTYHAQKQAAGGVQRVAPGQGEALMQALAKRGLNDRGG